MVLVGMEFDIAGADAIFVKRHNCHRIMEASQNPSLKDGDQCTVVAGTHKGKSGTVRDLNLSKTGHLTITVEQANGVRFKTLGRNVEVVG